MSKATIDYLNSLPDEKIAIDIKGLTKDYGKGRGLFDISLRVPLGCTFGYCGTNGAGKTTTLRHIMGFVKPDKGTIKVLGLDPRKDGAKIKESIGYLPGEIAFPTLNTGSDFIASQASLIGLTDMSKAENIINRLQLDPTANLKRMSKGMKQKTALVTAFMHSPNLILLDEPTTGLDPLMREAFIEIIEEEKARGATILMSNHMFDELEETCDYVAFIQEGKIIDVVSMEEIHSRPYREYFITYLDEGAYQEAFKEGFEVMGRYEDRNGIMVKVDLEKTQEFLAELGKFHLKSVNEIRYTLERYFMETFGGNINGSDSQE